MPKFLNDPAGKMKQILYYSSLAGSAYNSQPWKVVVYSFDSVQIFSDISRFSKDKPNMDRNVAMSIGAFVENFEIAAANIGYKSEIRIDNNSDGINTPLVYIKITKNDNLNKTITLTDIAQRRTLRTEFSTDELTYEHIEQLAGIDRGHIHYFNKNTQSGQYISESTQKLADLSAGNKSDKSTKHLIDNSAGWIAVMYDTENVMNWINAGRLYQRMNLKCRKIKIGFHPMNQIVNNADATNEFMKFIKSSDKLLFLTRIGYVATTPQPVTSRRGVDEFTIFK